MVSLKNPILMAVIGAAHGIKGELRVKTFTGDPQSLADFGPLFDKAGRSFEIESLRAQGNVVVVRLKGVNDRNAAEALNGTELFVERSALGTDLEDEEFFHADLVGMDVLNERGEKIGKVSAVQNYGAGDILEIKGPGLNGALVPFTRAAVPVVDVAMRLIRIDTLAAGLGEDVDGDGEPEAPAPPGDGFDAKRRPRGPKDAGGNR